MQRTHIQNIKKCNEIEQHVKYLKSEIETLGIQIPDYDPSPEDFEKQGGQYLLEQLRKEVGDSAAAVRQLSEHSTSLKEAYIGNLEHLYLMIAGQNLVHKKVCFSDLQHLAASTSVEMTNLSRSPLLAAATAAGGAGGSQAGKEGAKDTKERYGCTHETGVGYFSLYVILRSHVHHNTLLNIPHTPMYSGISVYPRDSSSLLMLSTTAALYRVTVKAPTSLTHQTRHLALMS